MPSCVLCLRFFVPTSDFLLKWKYSSFWSIRRHCSPDRRLTVALIFSRQKRRLRGDLTAAFQYLKGACKKGGDKLSLGACCDRTRRNGFKQREGRFTLDKRENFFYAEGGETLAQVAQRGGRCPIPGHIQGQVGWGSEQPDLVEDVPAHGRGVGLDGLQRSLPTQTVLSFDDAMIFFQ